MKFNIEQFIEASKLSSMDHWFPLTKNLPIPQPRTEAVLTQGTDKWHKFLENPNILNDRLGKLINCAKKLGYPLFIRTDQSSAKHSYVDTCKVESMDKLGPNLYRLIEENIMCDQNIQTLYFRSFIELDSVFTAFNKMPIAPERRYFVKDGEVLCHHPYWPEAAIKDPDHENWESLLRSINFQEACEVILLKRYATIISMAVPGCWSVDFAKAKNGVWYFIDMADARLSWHPEDCKNYKELTIENPDPPKPCGITIIDEEDEEKHNICDSCGNECGIPQPTTCPVCGKETNLYD
jgi:hypothetical protein